jgi:hypothetical protein
MKNKWYVLLLLALFVLVNGFGQEKSVTVDSDLLNEIKTILQSIEERTLPNGNLIPLTADIVKLIANEDSEIFQKLDFYLSSDLNLTTMQRKVEAGKNGGLEIDNGNTVQITKILKTSKGKCVKYDPKTNEENFLINFQGYDHVLQFVRNTRTDRFDFYAMDGISTFESPRSYLCIFVDQKGEALFQRDTAVRRDVQLQAPARLPASDQSSVLIMGNGRLSADAIVAYILNKGSAMNRQQVNALVSLYIREAQTEGINHDIAVAQMCYATRFLNNRQLLDTFNYAGLNTDMGISVRGGSSHIDYTEGVRAHIQHLKGYASRDPLRYDVVDRRYDLLKTSGIRGTIKTLDELFAVWSPYNSQGYGNEIRRIMRELYQFQANIR